MPYRIDISRPSDRALDKLVELGALDVDTIGGAIAAILPDDVTSDEVARALDTTNLKISPAIGRDDGSVWMLLPRPVQVGGVVMALTDSSVFGTGHHPTTLLCIDAIGETLRAGIPESVLDVGTGSGVLALAALMLGVPRAVGVDIDPHALEIAAQNSRFNDLDGRLKLILGGPDSANGTWPLVVANVLAAPLIEMAPQLVRRIGNRGRLILSGIPQSLEFDVARAYQWLGMRNVRSETRAGWTVIMLDAAW